MTQYRMLIKAYKLNPAGEMPATTEFLYCGLIDHGMDGTERGRKSQTA